MTEGANFIDWTSFRRRTGVLDSDFSTLRKCVIFAPFSPDELREILIDAAVQKFPRNAVLFMQNEPAKRFYIVLEGCVKILRETADGHESVLRLFKPGESFAEASILQINGYPATASDLELGQFVELEGEVNFSNATGTAREVSHSASIIGPVEGVNAQNRQLTVLGQTVLIDEDTAFAGSIDPATLAGLAIGATAQISGFRNAEDHIVATRIAPDTRSDGVQLAGTVADLDLANMRFSISGLDVDYGNATVIDLPAGMPEIGRPVMVRGSLSNGVLAVKELASHGREE